MANTNIQVAQAIAFGNGAGDKMPLSLVEQGIIRNLKQSQTILLRSGLSGTWVGKGTLRYDITGFSKTNQYNPVTNNKQKPYAQQKFVHLDERRVIAWEVEDLDKENLSGTLSPFVNTFIANQTASVEADLKYWFYKGQMDFYDEHPENTAFLPELTEERVLTLDQSKFLQKQLSLIPIKMSKKYNSKYLGVPTNEFVGVIDGLGALNIDLLLTGLNLSKSSFDTIVNGYTGKDNGSMFNFGGFKLIVDNMLNNDISQGASFNGDYSVDFATKGFLGAIHHQDSILFPTTPFIFKRSVDNDNFNDLGCIKYEEGFGLAYEDLICGLFNKLKAYADRNEDGTMKEEVVVGETLQLYTNASSLRTITWTSSDDTKATVSNGKVTGVGAGTVTITATLTDANLSGSPFTATYEVEVVTE